ncbi:MAG: hypothetical protein H7232_11785 [Aeromicrobium sp.]|nr:hypothetical protein [Burkholderiales bacterium]
MKPITCTLSNVCAVAAHPGWVATDATAAHGSAPLTPNESVALLIKVIDGLTINATGKFFDPGGTDLPLATGQTKEKFYGKPRSAVR